MSTPREHVFVTPKECYAESPESHRHMAGTCPICDGGLAWCRVCHEGEAGLAKECPGEYVPHPLDMTDHPAATRALLEAERDVTENTSQKQQSSPSSPRDAGLPQAIEASIDALSSLAFTHGRTVEGPYEKRARKERIDAESALRSAILSALAAAHRESFIEGIRWFTGKGWGDSGQAKIEAEALRRWPKERASE